MRYLLTFEVDTDDETEVLPLIDAVEASYPSLKYEKYEAKVDRPAKPTSESLRLLHEAFMSSDMSLYELAQHTGLSERRLYTIFKHQRTITPRVAVKIGAALGLDPTDLEV